MIGEEDVARTHLFTGAQRVFDLILDRLLHGAEMDGNVRRVGDQATGRVEHCATVVQTLLDVGRHGRALKYSNQSFNAQLNLKKQI